MQILITVTQINKKVGMLMVTLSDFQSKLQRDADDIAQLTDVVTGVETLLNSQTTNISTLSQSVKDLQAQLAAGGTITAADLQTVADAMDEHAAANEVLKGRLAQAVIANTPSAPSN